MKEIVLVYSDLKDRETIENYESKNNVFLSFLDYNSRKSKKKAWELMEEWGARKTPFVVVKDGDSVIKCLYTEDGNCVIKSLIERYL